MFLFIYITMNLPLNKQNGNTSKRQKEITVEARGLHPWVTPITICFLQILKVQNIF